MARLKSQLTKLREQAMETLSSASKTRVGPMEAICRNTLGKLDIGYQELQNAFISFDNEMDRFLTKWLGPQARFPDLDSHLSVNLYYESISSNRDAVRGLLIELGHTIQDRRDRANNLLAFMLSIATLLVAIIALAR